MFTQPNPLRTKTNVGTVNYISQVTEFMSKLFTPLSPEKRFSKANIADLLDLVTTDQTYMGGFAKIVSKSNMTPKATVVHHALIATGRKPYIQGDKYCLDTPAWGVKYKGENYYIPLSQEVAKMVDVTKGMETEIPKLLNAEGYLLVELSHFLTESGHPCLRLSKIGQGLTYEITTYGDL